MPTCEYCVEDFTEDDFINHNSQCIYMPMECNNKCGIKVYRHQLDKHLSDDCIRGISSCIHCNQNYINSAMKNHHKVCPKMMIPCPNECDLPLIPREHLDFHYKEVCSGLNIPCPFQDTQCSFKGSKIELEQHMKENCTEHLNMLSLIVVQHKHDMRVLESQFVQCQREWTKMMQIITRKETDWTEEKKELKEEMEKNSASIEINKSILTIQPPLEIQDDNEEDAELVKINSENKNVQEIELVKVIKAEKNVSRECMESWEKKLSFCEPELSESGISTTGEDRVSDLELKIIVSDVIQKNIKGTSLQESNVIKPKQGRIKASPPDPRGIELIHKETIRSRPRVSVVDILRDRRKASHFDQSTLKMKKNMSVSSLPELSAIKKIEEMIQTSHPELSSLKLSAKKIKTQFLQPRAIPLTPKEREASLAKLTVERKLSLPTPETIKLVEEKRKTSVPELRNFGLTPAKPKPYYPDSSSMYSTPEETDASIPELHASTLKENKRKSSILEERDFEHTIEARKTYKLELNNVKKPLPLITTAVKSTQTNRIKEGKEVKSSSSSGPKAVALTPQERQAAIPKLKNLDSTRDWVVISFPTPTTIETAQGLIQSALNPKAKEFVFGEKTDTTSVPSKVEPINTPMPKNPIQYLINDDIVRLSMNIDGKFMWTLTNWSEKLKKSQHSGEVFVAHFYTQPECGHRLQVDIHPNGCKEGVGKFVSVFIKLIPGKYDSVIKWPFKKTITITLLDPYGTWDYRKDIVKTIKPNPENPVQIKSFQRPDNAATPGIGCVTFVSHHYLVAENFVKDNTIYLQIDIS